MRNASTSTETASASNGTAAFDGPAWAEGLSPGEWARKHNAWLLGDRPGLTWTDIRNARQALFARAAARARACTDAESAPDARTTKELIEEGRL